MDIVYHGFEGSPTLNGVAAEDLVSLTPYAAVLKDCQLAVERDEERRRASYQASVQLTLLDDEALSVDPVSCDNPEAAIRGAFEEARRLLRCVANSTRRSSRLRRS